MRYRTATFVTRKDYGMSAGPTTMEVRRVKQARVLSHPGLPHATNVLNQGIGGAMPITHLTSRPAAKGVSSST